MFRPFVALVALASLWPSMVSGLGPLDNDAGSGGDAGDEAMFAARIGTGSFQGALASGIDEKDWYVFEADEGAHVALSVETGGGPIAARLHGAPIVGTAAVVPYAWSMQDRLVFVLPYSGAWYVEMYLDDLAHAQASYGFSLSVSEPRPFLLMNTTSAASTLEIKAEGDVFVWARQTLLETSVLEPAGTMLGFQAVGQGGPISTMLSNGGGAAPAVIPQSVAVGPVAASVGDVLAEDEAPADAWTSVSLWATDVTTMWARIMRAASAPSVYAEILLWSDTPLAWAMADVAAVMAWHTSDMLDGDDVLVPGVAWTDGGTVGVDVVGHFIGFLLGDPGHARAEDPTGITYEVGDNPVVFLDPVPGRWRLEVDPVLNARLDADRLWFMGVSLPHLGIAGWPPWGCPRDCSG